MIKHNKVINKLSLLLAMLALTGPATSFANQAEETQKQAAKDNQSVEYKQIKREKPVAEQHCEVAFPFHNQVSFGPELLWYGQDKKIDGVNSKGNRFFSGFRLSYQYIQPNAFFADVSIATATSRVDFNADRAGQKLDWARSSRVFGQSSLKLGYTYLSSGKSTLASPFLGIGNYMVFGTNHYNDEGLDMDSFSYAAAGVNFKHAFNRTFYLGCNMAALYAYGNVHFNLPDEKFKATNALWGAEVALPLTWCFSDSRHWDFQFEPYYLTLGFSSEQMVAGTRLLFNFNF